MRFRRRHTKNFTTIGNELFDDERLAADEIGVLAYLLSRPADWEIRRPALMRRFKYGRDGMRRVITNWIRTGWCFASKTRLSNGTFSIIYEIRDEPGPSLSEDEVRAALSLVSSEAGDGDSADNVDAEASEPPDPGGQPVTPQPPLADQHTVTRRWPIEGLPNTDESNTDSTQALWSEVRKLWPIGHMVSPFVCENLFAALSINDREAAKRGIASYLSDCRAKNRKVCDLAKYLKERRWEGQSAAASSTFATKGGTPQAFRWLAYRKARGESTAYMEECWRMGKPYTFPSEWPPALTPGDRTGAMLSPETENFSALADELEGRK